MCFFFKRPSQPRPNAPEVELYREEARRIMSELPSTFECVTSTRDNYMLYLRNIETGKISKCSGSDAREFWPKALATLNDAITANQHIEGVTL